VKLNKVSIDDGVNVLWALRAALSKGVLVSSNVAREKLETLTFGPVPLQVSA
jgi:hypothetical protein